MKKIISLICAISLSAAAAVNVMAAPSVYLDGEKLTFDVEPFIENDRTMVPLRGIFEACNAVVQWDQETKTVMALKDLGNEKKVITLQIGNPTAFVDNTSVTLEAPAKVINDRTFVPLRFINESLGAVVDWDGDTETVTITTK